MEEEPGLKRQRVVAPPIASSTESKDTAGVSIFSDLGNNSSSSTTAATSGTAAAAGRETEAKDLEWPEPTMAQHYLDALDFYHIFYIG